MDVGVVIGAVAFFVLSWALASGLQRL